MPLRGVPRIRLRCASFSGWCCPRRAQSLDDFAHASLDRSPALCSAAFCVLMTSRICQTVPASAKQENKRHYVEPKALRGVPVDSGCCGDGTTTWLSAFMLVRGSCTLECQQLDSPGYAALARASPLISTCSLSSYGLEFKSGCGYEWAFADSRSDLTSSGDWTRSHFGKINTGRLIKSYSPSGSPHVAAKT